MQELQAKYTTSNILNFQHQLRDLEDEAESLRDSFAERFNDTGAVLFEADLKRVAEAARRQGYEASNAVRGLPNFSERPWFEEALSNAGLLIERDTPLYKAFHDFFSPHFMAGFDDPLPPDFVAKLETDHKEHDPSLN
jgi:hypothetical protein